VFLITVLVLLVFCSACTSGEVDLVVSPPGTASGTEPATIPGGAPGANSNGVNPGGNAGDNGGSKDGQPPSEPDGQEPQGGSSQGSGTEEQPGETVDQQATDPTEPATPGTPETPTAPTTPEQTTEPTTPPPTNPGTPDVTLDLPPSDGGPVVLTIRGAGVSVETTWTLGQLQALRDGYKEYTYSTTNNWPAFGHSTAHGVSLRYLLNRAGMQSGAAGFRLIASDGYNVTVTYNQVFGTRHTYSSHSASGSSGASAVEPIISWEWGDDGRVRADRLRSFFGQAGPRDVNTLAFVRQINQIEVLTASLGAWAAPGASVPDGATVTGGSVVSLTHDNMDNIKIYYTLDGSEPSYSSAVYNPSTSNFQPHLTMPLLVTQDVTIKAFAGGLGRADSPVVSFSYKVE